MIPGSSGGVDLMHASATSVCRWSSSEGSCGLEELLLGINSGREDDGGVGEVCDTSELLTADEGGREDITSREVPDPEVTRA